VGLGDTAHNDAQLILPDRQRPGKRSYGASGTRRPPHSFRIDKPRDNRYLPWEVVPPCVTLATAELMPREGRVRNSVHAARRSGFF
jgi:hypothetical protein